jgi:hypothetical protein
VVGEQGRGVRAVGECVGFDRTAPPTQRVDDASLFLQGDALPLESHANGCKEDEIVAEGEAGALTRAFAHMLAKPAVQAAIAFVFAYAQLRRVDTDVSKHTRSSPSSSHTLYFTLFFSKKQEHFENVKEKHDFIYASFMKFIIIFVKNRERYLKKVNLCAILYAIESFLSRVT